MDTTKNKNSNCATAPVSGLAILATYMGYPSDDKGYHRKQIAPYVLTKPEYLKYHLEWQWLMPVVTKICTEKFEDGEQVFFHTFGMKEQETGFYLSRISRHQLFHGRSLIEATFLSCVDYASYKLAGH